MTIQSPHPSKSLLGWGTDHFSHYGSGLLFIERGLDIYRYPVAGLCLSTGHDLCRANILDKTLDLKINWLQLSRPYPPWVYVYHLPESIATYTDSFSERTIRVMVIIKYLFFAHLLVFALFVILREVNIPTWILLPSAVLISIEILRWTASGFYDGIAILGVCLAYFFFFKFKDTKKHYLIPYLLYALAVGLHYRMLWFLPIGAYAGVRAILRYKEFKLFEWICWISASVVALFSAYAFIQLIPTLDANPWTNTFHWRNPQWPWMIYPFFVCVSSWVAVHWRNPDPESKWICLFTMGTLFLFTLITIQVMPWHSLCWIPFLVMSACAFKSRFQTVSWVLAMAIYLWLGTWLYQGHPVSFDFFTQVWGDLQI